MASISHDTEPVTDRIHHNSWSANLEKSEHADDRGLVLTQAIDAVNHTAASHHVKAVDAWEMTGLAQFTAFDLQFFLAGEPAFWYVSGENLTPAQVVCHSLVNNTGSRRVSYALLLIEHVQIDEEILLNTAAWYGLESTVSDMYAFLEDGSEQRGGGDTVLPKPAEYESLKSQYEVA